jgi:hypothetical protein
MKPTAAVAGLTEVNVNVIVNVRRSSSVIFVGFKTKFEYVKNFE